MSYSKYVYNQYETIGILHVHPGGTRFPETVVEILDEINPGINPKVILDRCNDGIRTMLFDDEVNELLGLSIELEQQNKTELEYSTLTATEKEEIVAFFSLPSRVSRS